MGIINSKRGPVVHGGLENSCNGVISTLIKDSLPAVLSTQEFTSNSITKVKIVSFEANCEAVCRNGHQGLLCLRKLTKP